MSAESKACGKGFKSTIKYLDFNIVNSLGGSNDWSANNRWECVQWKIGAGISTFHELNGQAMVNDQYKNMLQSLTPVPLSQTMIFLPWLSISHDQLYLD